MQIFTSTERNTIYCTKQKDTAILSTRKHTYHKNQENRKDIEKGTMKLTTLILLSVFAVAFTALQTEGRRLRSEAFGERILELDNTKVSSGPFMGWWKNGLNKDKYHVGILSDTVYVESKKSSTKRRFGGLMHMRRPGHFLGKSVKFTAKVKTADVISGTANLWFRVDGKNKKVLAFDNMYDRPITGTTGWKKYSIVLDVPEDAQRLAYGIFVGGEGKAWMKDFTLVEERILELDEMEDDDEAAGAFKIGNGRYNFNFWGDEHEDVYDEEAGRRWPGRPGPNPNPNPLNPNPPIGQFRL